MCKEENKQKTETEALVEILKKDAKHLTPQQLANYAALFEAASNVGPEYDWLLPMYGIMRKEVGRNPLYKNWEHLIINALKDERDRFTPEQLEGYIALVKAASKAAPEDYWLKPILELIRKGLGYKFWIEYEH